MSADGEVRCAHCGGPHPFDTVIPNPAWVRVVRAAGLPEFLCLTCIVAAFARAGEGFTAVLYGQGLDGLAIDFRIGGKVATDAAVLVQANVDLTLRLREIRGTLRACAAVLEGETPTLVSMREGMVAEVHRVLEQRMP